MIIYYINPYAKMNGPFTVVDKDQNHLLCMGDFCVRLKNNCAELLYINRKVTKSLHWEHLIVIEEFRVDVQLMPKANCILYSVDNIKQRCGNIDVLKYLMNISRRSVVKDFFHDAINILTYNSDKLNGNVYYKLISNVLEKGQSDRVSDLANMPFYNFLSPVAQKYLNEILPSSENLKSAFKCVKEKYKDDFISAMNSFRKQYPNKTIYDVSEGNVCHIGNVKEQFEFIYKELANRGYLQIRDNVWQDDEGRKYSIEIREFN